MRLSEWVGVRMWLTMAALLRRFLFHTLTLSLSLEARERGLRQMRTGITFMDRGLDHDRLFEVHFAG